MFRCEGRCGDVRVLDGDASRRRLRVRSNAEFLVPASASGVVVDCALQQAVDVMLS